MANPPPAFDIVTLTLNPAIDETVFLDRLTPGTVNRARGHHRQPGGKGVNVSAMLAGYGIPSTATGFLGRENPRLFEELFRESGIRDECVRIAGETRTGIKILSEATRETTDINFPGARPGGDDFEKLLEKLRLHAAPGRWIVVAGSLPDGISTNDFASLLRLIKQSGARIAVDTSGPALQAAIDCGVDLIKPNHHELAEIQGRELPDTAARVAAATRLQREKVPHVILSLGSEGAIFASPEGSCMAGPPPVKVVSTVGAGDSMLAGYLAGLHTGLPITGRAQLASVFAWCALEDVRRKLPPLPVVEMRMAQVAVQPL
ncbi:MAG: 1-phosphofructokinase [Verrucomicrobiaceae bacterium]|nr:MAG: 1-phosphofructokinase [Verrucomicrobiaceae bacterium]